MVTFKTALKNWSLKAKRIALLGVGSELRGDDAAGLLVAQELARLKLKKRIDFKVFIGGTAPENLTGEIKRFKPTHLIIVDSADMGKKAGAVQWIDPDKVGGLSFCTHSLPVKIMADYLTQSIGCKIKIIGIQPKVLEFGSRFSKTIEKTVKNVSKTVKASIQSLL